MISINRIVRTKGCALWIEVHPAKPRIWLLHASNWLGRASWFSQNRLSNQSSWRTFSKCTKSFNYTILHNEACFLLTREGLNFKPWNKHQTKAKWANFYKANYYFFLSCIFFVFFNLVKGIDDHSLIYFDVKFGSNIITARRIEQKAINRSVNDPFSFFFVLLIHLKYIYKILFYIYWTFTAIVASACRVLRSNHLLKAIYMLSKFYHL